MMQSTSRCTISSRLFLLLLLLLAPVQLHGAASTRGRALNTTSLHTLAKDAM